MESLLVLLGLIVLAIPVGVVVLLIGHVRLRKRVEQLEQRLADQSGPAPKPEPEKPAQAADTPPPVEAKVKGPWAPTKPPPKPSRETQPSSPPAAIVMRDDRFAALFAWLRENWFYAVSALSLALAGIFLVQYGVENGLLPPAARVFAALAFGAALILGGEVVRRRFGDDEDSATAYLPSVFSGAGLVTLFGAVLAARQLYDLIGPEAALAGMVAIAIVGLVLGWFHGPLLAAVGLIGAFAAPFVVGGASEDPTWLYGYFLLIAALGLGIDTVRRWAWISVLTLVGAYGACFLLVLSSPITEPGYLISVTALALMAIAIPVRRLVPNHDGPMIAEIIRRKKGAPWPEFPTRLAFGAVLLSSVILSIHWADTSSEFWLSVGLFAALTLALILWASDAPALQDMTVFPGLGLIWFVLLHGFDGGVVAQSFAATYAETPEADAPLTVSILVVLGAALSLAAAWRSFRGGRYAAAWATGAVVFAPLIAIALEVGWQPASVIGAYPWALHAVALGAVMVLLAERFARVDTGDRLRPALATMSALSCLSFACVIVLSSAALTVALVVSVLAAAVLDRRFVLPQLSWFVWVGVFTVTVRLILNPGLEWAETAPLPEVIFAYGAATLGFATGWWVLRPMPRPTAVLLLESAAWANAGILLSLLLLRWLESLGEGGAENSHWGLGLLASIWLLLAFAQVQRFSLGGKLTYARYALAGFFAAHALIRLGQALGPENPVLTEFADPVLGPGIVNTLAVAYLLPALIILLSLWRLTDVPVRLRQLGYAAAALLLVVWLGMTIRHFWQGAGGMFEGNGVSQPELYTYTMALLLVGAGLFYQSLARGSDLMRKAGLAVIGLAVAKVFLIDIAGLGGLIRVFSLLVLGLALAGLAWLNRWAKLRHSSQGAEPLDD
ncbi:DUF2339 domain-containing protein [Ruegeria sp. HKCCA6707]|uniref:DUF2339 domain-containing protein n=1 Tax=Ruegeria sp. HKCCA6707 TaxID=2682996 RepID=UPI0014883DFA|nr:DUF2339 domain-containing protein [Ruegeria sp. HKCCA6707]